MASRQVGGRAGKLKGHEVERRARNLLLRPGTVERAIALLAANGAPLVSSAPIAVAVIGGVSVGVAGGGKLTTPKTDILLHQGGTSGCPPRVVGLSIKKTKVVQRGKASRRERVAHSNGQAWDVPLATFVELLSLTDPFVLECLSAFARGEVRAIHGGAGERARLAVERYLASNIEKITRLVFSRGAAAHELFWATHLWFVPETVTARGGSFGELFDIEELGKRATLQSVAVSWKAGRSSIELPWGTLQKTRSSNTSLQFRHDLGCIRRLFLDAPPSAATESIDAAE